MRLHLVIQRNGLPTTQILWTVTQPVKPLHNAAAGVAVVPFTTPSNAVTSGTGITISQFLEQVNEIIPLEADYWGLEDYAVEVHGFECLHFSELRQVLREDDEVCIRPLQTSDLRARRFSGRHQISADGKHLIDGVAFGRPFLRKTDRPPVKISPRKRKQVASGGEEEENEVLAIGGDNERWVTGRADVGDEGEEGDESEDDQDFHPDDGVDDRYDEVEGLEDEMEGLQGDLQPDEERLGGLTRMTRRRSQKKVSGLRLDLFAGSGYSNPLLDQYNQDESDTIPAALEVRKGRQKLSSKKPRSSLSPLRKDRVNSTGSSKSVRFEEDNAMTPATELAINDEDDDDDDDEYLGSADETFDVDESDKENAEPAQNKSDQDDTSESSVLSSSESDSDEESDDNDTTSSSGTDISSTESDSKPAPKKSSSTTPKSSTVTGQSSGSSSIPKTKASSTTERRGLKTKSGTDDSTANALAGDSATIPKDEAATHPPVLPGKRTHKTHLRNLRRKASAALKFHKANGDLSKDATTADMIKLKEQNSINLPPWIRELRSKLEADGAERVCFEPNEIDVEEKDTPHFAVKRQALLDSLESEGGVDITHEDKDAEAATRASAANPGKWQILQGRNIDLPADQSATSINKESSSKRSRKEKNEIASSTKILNEVLNSTTFQTPELLPKANKSSFQPAGTQTVRTPDNSSQPFDSSNIVALEPSGSQRPRTRLDLASSKRLLFGSLGLRAPKTKDDELLLREKLMKDIKPAKTVRDCVETETAQVSLPPAENDDDSWKMKINLAAVECCHDGITYSHPPFPFVQRWDPRQQGTYSKRKGKKGKKRKRVDHSFYESYQESPGTKPPRKNPRQEDYSANTEKPQFDAAALKYAQPQESSERSHDQKNQDSNAANAQLLRENSESAAYAIMNSTPDPELDRLPDLPALPDDLTGYPELRKEDCSGGIVIAFKKFQMSAETNWQPRITSYLTAMIRELHGNGTLNMTLAERDQPKSMARFDEETGERLYDKFEMPGYDDEDAGNDRSKLEMPFDELISPRLIGPATDIGSGCKETQIIATSDPTETLVGDDAQRIMLETQAPASFDSAMDHPPRSPVEALTPFEFDRQDIEGTNQEQHWVGNPSPHPEKQQNNDSLSGSSLGFQISGSSPPANGNSKASPPLCSDPDRPQPHNTSQALADSWEPSQDSATLPPHSLSQVEEQSLPVQDQRQNRSMSSGGEPSAPSPGFVSPSPISRREGRSKVSPTGISRSEKPPEKGSKRNGQLDGVDETPEDFPELFSQASPDYISQESLIKAGSMLGGDVDEKPEATHRGGTSKERTNGNVSQQNGIRELDKEGANEDSSSRPSQLEILQSSQIVDSTIPSGSEYKCNETGITSNYQSSSGWLDKPNANIDLPIAKRTRKRKTRSAATMAY